MEERGIAVNKADNDQDALLSAHASPPFNLLNSQLLGPLICGPAAAWAHSCRTSVPAIHPSEAR